MDRRKRSICVCHRCCVAKAVRARAKSHHVIDQGWAESGERGGGEGEGGR